MDAFQFDAGIVTGAAHAATPFLAGSHTSDMIIAPVWRLD
jgi:hypothetical protein